jgi:hypothetical protein
MCDHFAEIGKLVTPSLKFFSKGSEILAKRWRTTEHHVIPKSVGGNGDRKNLCYVLANRHNLYHRLFLNLKPEQIVELLNQEFWNDNYQVSIKEVRE